MKNIPHSTTALVGQKNQSALLRRKEVESLTKLSRSQIYVLMARGEFPAAIRLTKMSVVWLETEVQAWIASRIKASRKTAEA